jgi:hypothetical protein
MRRNAQNLTAEAGQQPNIEQHNDQQVPSSRPSESIHFDSLKCKWRKVQKQNNFFRH